MTDISHAIQAKSDQLNADDIVGAEPVITIREVEVKNTQDQPVWVYYHGDNGRPWKPSKGMLRVLATAWGRDSDHWKGKQVQLYHDPDVKYAGQAVGGIRIKALSDIDKSGLKIAMTVSRGKRQPYTVQLLQEPRSGSYYPQDQLDNALPKMRERMESGEMTLQQVIAQCQKTAPLTEDQMKQIEAVAPVEIEEDEAESVESKPELEQETETEENEMEF